RIKNSSLKDIIWLHPEGREMTDQEWQQSFARCLGMHLSGSALRETDGCGNLLADDDFLLLFNAHDGEIRFALPSPGAWVALLDSGGAVRDAIQATYPLRAHCFALLTQAAHDRGKL
ncbi:MAG: hypothetical protein ACREUA_04295, partial [Burkholderiales bacterium]